MTTIERILLFAGIRGYRNASVTVHKNNDNIFVAICHYGNMRIGDVRIGDAIGKDDVEATKALAAQLYTQAQDVLDRRIKEAQINIDAHKASIKNAQKGIALEEENLNEVTRLQAQIDAG